ncbi:MAG: TolC family protein [Proteobacteria bacterium]|nr:TolC family protein [Pseudomonadota bacterium]
MRFRRSLIAIAFAATLALPAISAVAQEAFPGDSVESLLAYARERHPELRAMRYEADAAAQRVDPAGALPDPMFRAELQNVTNYGNDGSFSLSPANVGSTKYTISQSIPFWGKRDLRQGVAQADALQADRRVNATWTELAARIKIAYAQYQLAAHNEELAREVLALMGSLESLAQVRYASGLVPQQDAIRAQVEQTGMRTDLVMLDSERRQWQVKLNSLLTRPANAPLADPRGTRALPPPARLDPAALADRLVANNPQLAVEEARIQSAERGRDLTYRNRYPDFSVGVSPIQMGSRINEWELMLEVNIPLQQGSRRAQESEAESMLSAARSRKEAALLQARAELGEHVAALDAARRIEELLTTQLLPQAGLTLQSAMAAYENGRVDFATLLEAQRQIRKAKQDREKANAEAQMRLAEIERLLGEDL